MKFHNWLIFCSKSIIWFVRKNDKMQRKNIVGSSVNNGERQRFFRPTTTTSLKSVNKVLISFNSANHHTLVQLRSHPKIFGGQKNGWSTIFDSTKIQMFYLQEHLADAIIRTHVIKNKFKTSKNTSSGVL